MSLIGVMVLVAALHVYTFLSPPPMPPMPLFRHRNSLDSAEAIRDSDRDFFGGGAARLFGN